MAVSFLDPAAPDWAQRVDALRAELGAPHNPLLFPPHFLKATFPKIGGRIATYPGGAAFLYPRPKGAYTARYYGAAPPAELGVPYDPSAPQEYAAPAAGAEGVQLVRPSEAQARAVRELQREVWRSEEDYLYPFDLHSVGFQPGTSLVALVDGESAGFLFGFYRADGGVESQLLGVHPKHRARGIAFRLKAAQAEQARAQGVEVVSWTVDPLQLANALLNFGRLRAVAFDFYPDFYAFRNELNRLPASRLGITWYVGSRRVREALAQERGTPEVLAGLPRLTGGADPRGEPKVALEIPADWTRMQAEDADEAARWRQSTDRFFAAWLGYAEGKYVLTGAAKDGDRAYLVAERVSPKLLEELRR